MYSPFPGMDPFLEGYLWADVRQALAYQFRKQLVPLVEPAYAVRLAVYMLTDRVPASSVLCIQTWRFYPQKVHNKGWFEKPP